MAAQSKALQAEGQALQQQIAILAPDVKQKKIDAFQAKEAGPAGHGPAQGSSRSRAACSRRSSRWTRCWARSCRHLMQQRGANMILDKNAVVFANSAAFDITQPAIDQLNQKMSTLKVTLDAPPPPRAGAEQIRRAAWPIPAFTTIAALSRWPRFARRRASPCRTGADASARDFRSRQPGRRRPAASDVSFPAAQGARTPFAAPRAGFCLVPAKDSDAARRAGMTLAALRLGQPRLRRRRRACSIPQLRWRSWPQDERDRSPPPGWARTWCWGRAW